MLIDREAGKGVGMTLFETEDDLRRGDEALNAMSPEDVDADARRTSVSFYEVGLRVERGQLRQRLRWAGPPASARSPQRARPGTAERPRFIDGSLGFDSTFGCSFSRWPAGQTRRSSAL